MILEGTPRTAQVLSRPALLTIGGLQPVPSPRRCTSSISVSLQASTRFPEHRETRSTLYLPILLVLPRITTKLLKSLKLGSVGYCGSHRQDRHFCKDSLEGHDTKNQQILEIPFFVRVLMRTYLKRRFKTINIPIPLVTLRTTTQLPMSQKLWFRPQDLSRRSPRAHPGAVEVELRRNLPRNHLSDLSLKGVLGPSYRFECFIGLSA